MTTETHDTLEARHEKHSRVNEDHGTTLGAVRETATEIVVVHALVEHVATVTVHHLVAVIVRAPAAPRVSIGMCQDQGVRHVI